jgi:hypothetical protein
MGSFEEKLVESRQKRDGKKVHLFSWSVFANFFAFFRDGKFKQWLRIRVFGRYIIKISSWKKVYFFTLFKP